MRRRTFLKATAAGLCTSAMMQNAPVHAAPKKQLIIDTHQHLWDLSWQKLPWLTDDSPLARNFVTSDYLKATASEDVRAVYMEVDVAANQKRAEAEHVVNLSRDKAKTTVAAVVGGDPGLEGFADYVKFLSTFPEVKGVRQVLHGTHPKGKCLQPAFVKSIQLLGEHGLSFDLCMRSTDIGDGVKLAKQSPDTRFVLDHCGNMDPKAFLDSSDENQKSITQWKRDVAALATLPNTICKISGVIASVPGMATAEVLAPVVNHCLDSFGPERVVFGGDWPVCLNGAPLANWISILREIISSRTEKEQRCLWSENAIRFYGLQDVV
ncbi:MAG: amidohydrolase family protein [Planctomycetaceae bacterium]